MKEDIDFRLNGKPTKLEVEGDRMLLWVLRTDLGLTGTKFGCGASLCGACTVLIDGEPVLSCLTLAIECEGKKILTIEGLANPSTGELHPIQKAFVDCSGMQCGMCTPG
jgi:carbon-monoxide dehydrogenase small subunit